MLPTYGFPLPLLTAFAFLFGASVGSFLNVVIARVPFGQSIVWPPSHCMSCGTPIKPFHNVPIVSWFWLRGRCRTCLAPFSIRYAGIEFLYATVCALAVYRHGVSVPAFREILMMGFLVPLTFMDLDWWILPRELTWSGVAAGLGLALFEDLTSLGQASHAAAAFGPEGLGRALLQDFGTFLWRAFAASLGWSGLKLVGFVSERIVGREALGQGDPPLLGLIGAFLGPEALLPVLLLSSVQGVAVGIPMILVRRRKEEKEGEPEEPTSEAKPEPAPVPEPEKQPNPASGDEEDNWTPDPTAVPFGPFLSLAGAEVLYFTKLPGYLFPWPF